MNKRFILGLLIITILIFNTNIVANTYYVSKTGSDSNSGLSWGSAVLTISKVNSLMSAGDTVEFATGVWRDTVLLSIAGSFSDRTTYACSSFAETNGDGEYHFAKIYGSDSLSGWSLYSGNVYSTTYSGSVDINKPLFQGDTLLMRQPSLAAVNSPGKWYYNGAGTIFAWANGGGDPDNYQMEICRDKVVDLDASNVTSVVASDYVTFYGLEFAYGHTDVFDVDWYGDNDNIDSVFWIRCNIKNAAGDNTVNPGLISIGGGGETGNIADDLLIRACSLSGIWAIYTGSGDWRDYGTHGAGIMFYYAKNMLVDSCTFYGHFGLAAIFNKVGHYAPDVPSSDNKFAYNEFKDIYHGSAIAHYGYWKNPQIYGNVFENINENAIYNFYNDLDGGITRPYFAGGMKVYNNTFYNSNIYLLSTTSGTSNPNIPINNEWKYNVMMNTSAASFAVGGWCADSGWIDIDSNIWDISGSIALFKDGGSSTWDKGTSISTTNWVNTAGFDVHSLKWSYDPQFADAFNSDFRRLNASGEMWNIFNNDTFTVMGAWQPNNDTIPPNQVIDLGVINITDSSATVEWSTSIPSTSQVRFGLTPSFGQATATDPNYVTAHAMDLTNLLPDTLYYYQVVSIDTLNRVSYGPVNSFRSLVSSDTDPPIIANYQATQVTDFSATITWTTDEPATSQVEYGTSIPLTSSTSIIPTLVTSHGIGLTGLSPGKTYFFRVRSTDAPGNEAVSDTGSFVTQSTGSTDSVAPIVSNVNISNIDSTSVTITWSTNEPATSIVEYGFNTNYGNQDGNSSNLLLSHHVNLNGLIPGTTYQFRVRSTDGSGNEAIDVNRSFTTQISGGSASVNLALGIVPSVDGSGSGFNPSKITDGAKNPFDQSTSSWVSASNSNPHWVDINFGSDKIVEQFIIYWPWGSAASNWLTSQIVEVQNYNGSGFESVTTISNSTNDSVTIVDVGGFTSSRVRLYQNSNDGSTGIPSILALTEVEIIGYSSLSTGNESPSALEPKAFPNPFQPAVHTYLTIDNLPLDANIVITSVSGQIIKRLESAQNGSLIWDGTNESQSAVASGIYLWYLENGDNNGKIVLVN